MVRVDHSEHPLLHCISSLAGSSVGERARVCVLYIPSRPYLRCAPCVRLISISSISLRDDDFRLAAAALGLVLEVCHVWLIPRRSR
jgi:hypothetical protein